MVKVRKCDISGKTKRQRVLREDEKRRYAVRRPGRCRKRTAATQRATDTILKGMQWNFAIIVQKYLLLTTKVMTDDSLLKNETFRSEWFWSVWKERTAVCGRRSWLDGSNYKFSCFCYQHLQNLLNKNPCDTEKCKGGEKHIQRNGKKEIHNKAFGCSLCLMSWYYEFSSFSLNEVSNYVSLAADIAAIAPVWSLWTLHWLHFQIISAPSSYWFCCQTRRHALSHLHPNNRHCTGKYH